MTTLDQSTWFLRQCKFENKSKRCRYKEFGQSWYCKKQSDLKHREIEMQYQSWHTRRKTTMQTLKAIMPEW